MFYMQNNISLNFFSMNKVLVSFAVVIACASGAQRISGGNPTSIDQYPFAVSLLTNKQSSTFEQACGGTVLTSNAILSAASCFFTDGVADAVSSWRVRVGSSYSNTGGLVHILNRITIHPDFSPSTLQNDIAVLRVTWPLGLARGSIAPASFAGGAYSLENNAVATAIGWGATSVSGSPSDILQDVQIFIINQATCINRYNELNFTVTENMLCAGWLDVGISGQCPGDAGSPLVQNGVVVGVFSHVESCGNARYPSINTRVGAYSRWIYNAAYAA